MSKIANFIEKMNFYQKILLNTSLSVFFYWFLDGFGFKPLQDILFRFLNIVFSWSFDSEFGLLYKGYLHPDFIFIFCLIGLFIFKNRSTHSISLEEDNQQ
tara:strand:+ start:134 stop:433 length:300 start_codon:yes stop_codon:yes gene_type:complete